MLGWRSSFTAGARSWDTRRMTSASAASLAFAASVHLLSPFTFPRFLSPFLTFSRLGSAPWDLGVMPTRTACTLYKYTSKLLYAIIIVGHLVKVLKAM